MGAILSLPIVPVGWKWFEYDCCWKRQCAIKFLYSSNCVTKLLTSCCSISSMLPNHGGLFLRLMSELRWVQRLLFQIARSQSPSLEIKTVIGLTEVLDSED